MEDLHPLTEPEALGFREQVGRLVGSQFVRHVAETYTTRIFMVFLGLTTGVIVARALGPTGRGTYFVALTVGSILAQFGNFGLHASNTYFVSKDAGLLRRLTGNSLAIGAAFTGLVGVVGLVLSATAPDILPVHGALIPLIVVWVGLSVVYMLMQSLALGIGEVRSYNVVEIAHGVLGLALIGAVIVFGVIDPENIFAAGVIAMALGTGWIYWRVQRRCGGRPQPSSSLFRETFRYGVKAYAAAFAAFVVIRSDILVIDYLLGAEQTGYYSIAASLVDKLQILPITIGTLLFPRLSAVEERGLQWSMARRVAIGTFWLVLATCGAAALLATPAIRILFGSEFLPSVDSFYLLLPGTVALATNVILMNYLSATGLPPIVVIAPSIAALLNIALNLIMVPRFGIEGAAVSSSIAYTLMLAISIVYIRSKRVSTGGP